MQAVLVNRNYGKGLRAAGATHHAGLRRACLRHVLAAVGALVKKQNFHSVRRNRLDGSLALSHGCADAADTAELERIAPGFGTVVNTAPAPLLTARVLAALPAGSLIVDLASRPGGTDFAAAKAMGHTAIHALSLPAVYAPESAGEYIARTVLEILRERGDLV